MDYKYITPDMTVGEIAETYPKIVDMLIHEYGFHCVGCFVSQFETLEQGSFVHGIYEDDFKELMEKCNKMAEEAETAAKKTD